MENNLTFCTVITQSFLPQALILYESLVTYNEKAKFYALIIDKNKAELQHFQAPFTCIGLDQLEIHHIEDMVIYYDAFEMCNAVRPSLIKYLMLKEHAEKVIYLDADILVTGSFAKIDSLLDTCLFSFTPHSTEALPLDGQQPNDLQFLHVGLYNSGFWMFKKHERALEMLDWLISRFEIYCFDDLDNRMFCDQRLLPALIQLYLDDFKSLNSPQYNIAHWNVFQRNIYYEKGRYWVDHEPVVFFHLSGFDRYKPTQFSHHLHRMTAEKLALLQPLLQQYAQLLNEKFEGFVAEAYIYNSYQKTGFQLNTFRRRYYFKHRSFEGIEVIEKKMAKNIKLKRIVYRLWRLFAKFR